MPGTAEIGNVTGLVHCLWQMDYRKHYFLVLFQQCLGTVWSAGTDLGRLHVYQSSEVYLFLWRFQILLNVAQKMN